MKKRDIKKIVVLVFLAILTINSQVFASSIADRIKTIGYADEYLEYLELTDKKGILQPRMFEIEYENLEYYNPLKSATLLRTNSETSFSLQDAAVIPENVVVKDQGNTYSCWAFATLSSLETNLALKNKSNGIKSIAYDYSERHLEYATSRIFADGININSFNRTVGGGNWYISSAYLTNGTGAIPESQMEFENNENLESLSVLEGKTVESQVYDTVEFPSSTPTEITDEMINQIKNHIKNYGSVYASIHGAELFSDCYNNATGAIYCDGTGTDEGCPVDHAVSIIGWIDDYAVSNFNEDQRPNNPGAWIIKNSWGTAVGNNGIMYVSYEDINIYSDLNGIVKAADYIDYENIYQYNYLGYSSLVPFNATKAYVGNIFNKKTEGKEYLTQIGINVLESCTCKVYVNANGTDMAMSSLVPVQLKTGDSETLDGAGYHTLEFAEPIEVSSNFVVVVEMQDTDLILIESQVENTAWNDVTIESDKCFLTFDSYIELNEWLDLSEVSQINASLSDGDSTIKAFTTAEVDDNTLKEIKVTTLPKTAYFGGENFDKTGMVVTAYYNNGRTNIIDGYDIENGTNLQLTQNTVTIKYQGKSVDLPITVEENSVVNIRVKNNPTNTEYKAGENFDRTGMVIEATYKDGSVEEITEYEIVDGTNLKNEQATITIKYGDQTTTLEITVETVTVDKIEITKDADKTEYVVGQNFDKTGMIVVATYSDGRVIEITDYTIEDGENLTLEQIAVTIKYEGQTATQNISVEAKAVNSIQISKNPDKMEYIQGKEELSLTGGKILVKYNDGTEETISMEDENIIVLGFSNEAVGKIQVTITYQTKTTTLEVTIIEPETAKNSNLENANCNVIKVQSYTFTDEIKEEYIIMELEVTNIIRALENDKIEYYYYLSANQNENNIQNWVKITENQTNNNKLVFRVNTKDISNYEELVSSNVLYLYVREIAQKGGDQKVAISKTMLVESDAEIEEYLDNVKQENTAEPEEPKDEDSTTSDNKIPNAGKTAIATTAVLAIIAIGAISFKKYKNLKEI